MATTGLCENHTERSTAVLIGEILHEKTRIPESYINSDLEIFHGAAKVKPFKMQVSKRAFNSIYVRF